MHVESARGKQSQKPRKATFHKLVKFVRRVEMGLGSLHGCYVTIVCLSRDRKATKKHVKCKAVDKFSYLGVLILMIRQEQ